MYSLRLSPCLTAPTFILFDMVQKIWEQSSNTHCSTADIDYLMINTNLSDIPIASEQLERKSINSVNILPFFNAILVGFEQIERWATM